jgi:hypothetical protein
MRATATHLTRATATHLTRATATHLTRATATHLTRATATHLTRATATHLVRARPRASVAPLIAVGVGHGGASFAGADLLWPGSRGRKAAAGAVGVAEDDTGALRHDVTSLR